NVAGAERRFTLSPKFRHPTPAPARFLLSSCSRGVLAGFGPSVASSPLFLLKSRGHGIQPSVPLFLWSYGLRPLLSVRLMFRSPLLDHGKARGGFDGETADPHCGRRPLDPITIANFLGR